MDAGPGGVCGRGPCEVYRGLELQQPADWPSDWQRSHPTRRQPGGVILNFLERIEILSNVDIIGLSAYWQGTKLRPKYYHPIKKQMVFHEIQ